MGEKNQPIISMIAVIGKNRELGKDNKLIWDLPEELKHFRAVTSGHPVIMGKNTFLSIGHPMPGRLNIVVTRDKSYTAQGCIVVHSIPEAIEAAKDQPVDEVFVIGGGKIYEQAMPFADKLYLTLVDATAPADTYFPTYEHLFTKIISEEPHEEKGYHYRYMELIK